MTMAGTFDELIVERDEGLAVLRLNRPRRLNALSADMRSVLEAEVPRLVEAADVRAIMLTGVGRAFCAGGDVGDLAGPPSPGGAVAGMSAYHGWLAKLRVGEKPVIAAVNGVAAGAGFGLAMIADVVITSDEAYFKAGFTDLGVAADFGLGFTLPRAVGEARAAEILFSDRRVSAQEALQIGLAARIFPAASFAADALAFARGLARTPRSLQLTKRLLRHGQAEAFAAYLQLEAETQAEALESEDFREGVAAFLAKRRPNFRGR